MLPRGWGSGWAGGEEREELPEVPGLVAGVGVGSDDGGLGVGMPVAHGVRSEGSEADGDAEPVEGLGEVKDGPEMVIWRLALERDRHPGGTFR